MKQSQKTTICFSYIYIIHLLGFFVISFLTTNIVQMYVHVRLLYQDQNYAVGYLLIDVASLVITSIKEECRITAVTGFP